MVRGDVNNAVNKQENGPPIRCLLCGYPLSSKDRSTKYHEGCKEAEEKRLEMLRQHLGG